MAWEFPLRRKKGMDRAQPRRNATFALLAVIALVAGACGTATSPSPSAGGASPSGAAASPSAAGAPVEVEWFIGLGTGGNEEQQAAENKVVEEFNSSHPNIKLKVTIVDNKLASDTLATRIGSSDAPDIIGPVGIRGLQTFGDQLADLSPYTAGADLSGIEPSLVQAFNVKGKQIGLPTGIYPSFIYYNKALFKEAGVAEPPHEVGAKYEGKDWTWDTLKELAMKLTVDADGNDATSSKFNKDKTEQFGFDAPFVENDIRAWGTEFGGSGSVVGDDGKTAQVPDSWRTGLKFWYDGIWNGGWIPSKPEVDGITGSATDSNTFQFGHTAMAIGHQWMTCCIYPAKGTPPVSDWDIAVVPTGFDGKTTSKLHADTIGVLASSEHPAEAFEVIQYVSANADLVQTWGALPAIKTQRDAFFAARDDQFKPVKVDWTVSTKMLEFPDVPSHEGPMPNFAKSDASNKTFGNKLWTTPGLDLDKEFDSYVTTLQGVFDQAN
jgi:multiple sugar transport system substrate-binding protein